MYPLNDTHHGLIFTFMRRFLGFRASPLIFRLVSLFHSKHSVRTNHLTHHQQLNDTSVTSTPHTRINAHRPWACRGMPFDDVCPLSQQGAPTFSRWSGIFFYSYMTFARLWGGPRAEPVPKIATCRNLALKCEISKSSR